MRIKVAGAALVFVGHGVCGLLLLLFWTARDRYVHSSAPHQCAWKSNALRTHVNRHIAQLHYFSTQTVVSKMLRSDTLFRAPQSIAVDFGKSTRKVCEF